MAYTIIKNYISTSKHGLKCPYTMTPIGITVHNTYNDAPAINEIKYMISNDSSTSFHVAVDDINVVLGIPFNRNAWHAGDGSGTGNRKTIAIEICYSKSGGIKFDNAEKNAAKYIATLLKEYNWTTKNVYRHKDWNGKDCPHRTIANGWERFLNMIQDELDELNGVKSEKTTLYVKVDKVNKGSVLNIRKEPNTSSTIVGKLAYNDPNVYTIVEVKNGWGKLSDGRGWISLTYTKTVSAPAPTPVVTPVKKPDVIYQVYANGRWYDEITNYNEVNSNGYAGVFGKEISGIRVKLSNGKTVTVASHISGNANNNWLSAVTKWDNTSNGYSGWKGKPTDCIAVKADGHTLKYRVHVKGGNWLDWVSKYDINDAKNGVAGIYGKPIDAVQIGVV